MDELDAIVEEKGKQHFTQKEFGEVLNKLTGTKVRHTACSWSERFFCDNEKGQLLLLLASTIRIMWVLFQQVSTKRRCSAPVRLSSIVSISLNL